MGPSPSAHELWRVLGSAARLWARPEFHHVDDDWWTAYSGQKSVSYNLACCHASSPEVLAETCLEPTLALKKPAVIMLSGPGLAAAQKLSDSGWMTVGALPLMLRPSPLASDPGAADARRLSGDDLAAARGLVRDRYWLDADTAAAAYPDVPADSPDFGVWGLFDGGELVSSVATVVQDGLLVIWSMVTLAEAQGRGHGRRLLESVFAAQDPTAVTGSLLHS
ncbi:MAG: GNAT family N-acetyltransferase, partial [Acidimicrobiales bacterium]